MLCSSRRCRRRCQPAHAHGSTARQRSRTFSFAWTAPRATFDLNHGRAVPAEEVVPSALQIHRRCVLTQVDAALAPITAAPSIVLQSTARPSALAPRHHQQEHHPHSVLLHRHRRHYRRHLHTLLLPHPVRARPRMRLSSSLPSAIWHDARWLSSCQVALLTTSPRRSSSTMTW